MKALKIVGFVLVAIVVLVVLVLALALTPAIQTWAVRKAVAGQPGMTLEVSRVAAGFSAADISDLRMTKDGMVITAKGVSAKYSAWDFLTKDTLNADSVTVDDLVVDLRNAKPAFAPGTPAGATPSAKDGATQPAAKDGKAAPASGEAAKKEPFQGVLTQAQLPFDVRVASLAAKGKALLTPEQVVTFDLKGAGIETGQKGKVEWTVDFADATTGAPLRALRSTGTAGLHIAKDRRIDAVDVDTIVAAMGPNLPNDRVQLVARAEQPIAKGDEGYSANISLLRGTSAESLMKVSAQYAAANREIAGAWDIAVRGEQLAALLSGLGLPPLAITGGGRFSLKPDTTTVAATGDLQGAASQLEKVSPTLAGLGAVRFKLTFDGGLAGSAAQLNKLELETTAADGRRFAQITATQKLSYDLTTKRVGFADAKAELARISLQSLPLAWAQPVLQPMVIESGDLSMLLAVNAEPDGSRVLVRAIEPVALRTVTLRSGEKKLIDQLTFTTRPQIDYSATRITAELADLSITLPAGDAVTGKVSANVTNFAGKDAKPTIAFTTDINAKVVAALKPYLPLDLGPLAVVVSTQGQLEGDIAQLAKVNTTVHRGTNVLLSSIELQQPVRADLKAKTFTVGNPTATAARVTLGEIPLAWAEAFVPKSKFAGSMSGAVLEVSMRSAEDVTLTTTQPLALRGVSVTMDGKPQVQALDLSADLTATKRGEVIAYDVRKVEVKQGASTLAALNVAGEAKLGAKLTAAAKGSLDADVAALMNQPALLSFATLSRGQVTASFDAALADATQARLTLSAKNLVARQDSRALGNLELSLQANMKEDGSGTLTMPLTLTNAQRKSDLNVDAAFGKAADKKTFLLTGKVASAQLVVDDFQPLAALAPSSDKKTPTPTTPKPTRDEAPFWKGVNGKLELDLKRVLYGKDYVVSGIRGTATITDSRLALDGLEGRFKENPFKLAAGVNFAATQPKPYALTGTVDVTNLEIGEILRSANPSEKPALESKLSVIAKLNGNGGTVGDLAKNVYGVFDVTGTQGILRALGRKGQTVSTVSSIVGIIGAARGSNTTVAVSELANALNELQFERFTMRVERAADLSLKLSTLEFISPFMRATGTGGITNTTGNPDTPIQNQPMRIQLQFGAKDHLAQLLNRAGVLSGQADEKGYYLMSQNFTIGGTAAKPDSSSLWQMIGAAAARAAASSLLK